MKKIVFVCDVDNFSSSAFKFIETLHEKEAFLLTGAFFHSTNFDVLIPSNLAFAPDPILAFTNTDIDAVENSIQRFERKCLQSGIEYRVHEESNFFKLDDFIRETRFADLVVISGKLFFSHIDPDQPNSYLKQILHESECPVLIVAEEYSAVTHVTVAYDGKRESMFAIKQFCYLFPYYTTLPTDIAYWVNKTDDEIPDLDYLEEFASRHFTNLNFKELFFDREKYLGDWSRKNKNTLFISGSYNRSGLSARFKKSFIEDMIKQASATIFIAHNC